MLCNAMLKLIYILLFAIASCTEPLAPIQKYCVQYRIGNAEHTSTVTVNNGFVTCENWVLSITSTPNNATRLFRDTTIGSVYQSSEFLFLNNQVYCNFMPDTLRGVYISHSKGSVCNTYDTLPVTVTIIPCTTIPYLDR